MKFFKPIIDIWVITQGFGENPAKYPDEPAGHKGIDLRTKTNLHPDGIGTAVFATLTGVVLEAGISNSYGRYVKINHGKLEDGFTYVSLYAHLSKLKVGKGQAVTEKTVIGLSGGDSEKDPEGAGWSTAPHLHFEMRKKKIDNASLIKREDAFDSTNLLFDRPADNLIFTDLSEDHPHFGAIKWAKEEGLMSGYDDGRFGPDDPVTRGQMAQVLFNMKD